MKSAILPALAAGLIAALPAATLPTAATAQTAGIATSNPTFVILRSQARIDAYNQIAQTYAAQIQQVRTLDQEIAQLQQSLDTDSNGQISQAEAQANTNVVTQIQQKEQQVAMVSQPLLRAQVYVIDQLLADYSNAQNQVIQNKNIQIMLSPDAIQYAPAQTDVTNDIVTVLNQRMPQVSIAVPENWRPQSNQSQQVHEAVGQLTALAIRQQAIQQQQQGAPAPVTPAPQGR